MYKSHVVHVPSGEPPGSVSRPVPKKKAGVVKPITQGKLLRAGGPSVSIRSDFLGAGSGVLIVGLDRNRPVVQDPSLLRSHYQGGQAYPLQ